MCVCKCVCVCVSFHLYIHIHIYTHTHTYTYTHTHTTYARTHSHNHLELYLYIHTCIYLHIYLSIYLHLSICLKCTCAAPESTVPPMPPRMNLAMSIKPALLPLVSSVHVTPLSTCWNTAVPIAVVIWNKLKTNHLLRPAAAGFFQIKDKLTA